MDLDIDFFDSIEITKRFNSTGPCNYKKHYMVNIKNKLKEILMLVKFDKYFVINRPRQYGKTTTLNMLEKILKNHYGVVKLSFEGLGSVFETEENFCEYFIETMIEQLNKEMPKVKSFRELIKVIDTISGMQDVILIVDEVDRASNNELFLEFLGMLRALYIDRESEKKNTFKSVILAGVHDIKNLKIKFRDTSERKYNSPWNIAVNFNIDMSFNIDEIQTMINEYNSENKLSMDSPEISKEIHKFTSGYPFLVSRICQIIDEEIIGYANKRNWTIADIQKAVKLILLETNTLFDDLIKNLENNKELYEMMKKVILGSSRILYNPYNPGINMGIMFGYFDKDNENYIKISNLIFSELILDYLTSKSEGMETYNIKKEYLLDNE
ncbi:MAG: AAA family ATPase [Sarcina sp.]